MQQSSLGSGDEKESSPSFDKNSSKLRVMNESSHGELMDGLEGG